MDNFKLIRYSDIRPDILKGIFKKIVENYLKVSQKKLRNIEEEDKAKLMIEGLKDDFIVYYPGIENWFNKIIKEIDKDNRKRELFLVVVPNKGKIELAGILILKNTENEKKICTIRVIENFRNKGIGTKLFEKSFEYLETKTPFITLPEECYKGSFKFLLEKYSFKMSSKVVGVYRDSKVEYFFNEDK